MFSQPGPPFRAYELLSGLRLIAIVSSSDLEGRITEVNEKFCEISEYSPEELLGRDHRIINSGYHPKEFFRNMWETIVSGKIWRGEICNRTKSGRLYWVDSTIVPFRDEQGRIEGYTSFRFEITDRKNLESRLFEEKQKLQMILDSSKFGTWDWNPQTNEVEFDENWCRQLGLKREDIEMTLNTWESRVHPDDMAACRADIQAHVTGQSPHYENVHRMRHSDGRWIWILDRGMIITRDEHGAPLRFIGTHADISKQKEKELEYKRILETKYAILRSARFAIVTTEVDGLINGFNEEAERMLGYKAEEVVGKHSPLLFHALEEIQAMADVFSRQLKQFIPPTFEVFRHVASHEVFNQRQWSFVSKSGKRIPVQLSFTPLHDTTGQINGYMGIAKDLTEEIAVKQTIEQQRAKLVSSAKMAALGEMAAGIAHEVNNPLAIVAGKANLILQVLERDRSVDPKKLRDAIEKISQAAFRASKIIMSLKALSRNADTDPMTLLKVSDVVNEALGLCMERFKHNGIEIRLQLGSDGYFMGRSVQIAQILTNLLNNAFDALMPLPEKWVEIQLTSSKHRLRLAFIDAGSGVPLEVQSRLMQPFFTTKEVGKGTGLGLSISRKIAEEHGGDLYLDVSHAHTCFVLELPRKEPPSVS